MEEFGKGFVWLATKGFYILITVAAVVSLPNPLAIVWLGIIIVGTIASRFNYGGNNNAE
jgi:hypothetical protein